MAVQGQVFRNFLIFSVIQDRKRILQRVDDALLQSGVNLAQVHRNRARVHQLERNHMHIGGWDADLEALHISQRTNRFG